MKKQIVFIDRPHGLRTLSQQELRQQFEDDLVRLREKYGDNDQVIARAIAAAQKTVKECEHER